MLQREKRNKRVVQNVHSVGLKSTQIMHKYLFGSVLPSISETSASNAR